jgi:hypothetical protein
VSGEDQGDERKRTIDEVSKIEMTSKRAASRTPGLVQGKPAYCLSGVRHKDGVTLIQALVWNVGTCRSDDKGETQVEDPTRVRVPMRGTGADRPVLVKKSRNGDGAKGLDHPALSFGQPAMGGAKS